MKNVSGTIYDKLAEFSMDLKSKFDSNRSYHGDNWDEGMAQDILLGLVWDRNVDTVHPSVSININKKVGGKPTGDDTLIDPEKP